MTPDDPMDSAGTEAEARSRRLQGLGLVLLVMFAHTLRAALRRYGLSLKPYSSDNDPTLAALAWIVWSLSLIGLLAYVLFRQGRSLRELGVTANAADLTSGLALATLTPLLHAIRDVVDHGALGKSLISGLSLQM